jgi:glycosyltransferase involved in cell wall biosynthesis
MDKTVSDRRVTCIVHTRNSEATLEQCLQSVAWVDELIVVDMESSDRTVPIARGFAARLFSGPPVPRVDGIRNRYLEEAAHPWIIVLDSDEYFAADGEEIIRTLISENEDLFDAFAVPRYNYIAGQVMRGSGWYPDQQIRIFKKGSVGWEDTNHTPPKPVSPGIRVKCLDPPGCLHIHHLNYLDLTQFIQKQVAYAVNDAYDPDPGQYDFQDYVAKSYEEFVRIHDPLSDGDLSRALALVVSWDCLIRGLIHWERLDCLPPLGDALALPLVPAKLPLNISRAEAALIGRDPELIRERLRALEAIENSFTWKSLTRLNRLVYGRWFPPHTRRGRVLAKAVGKIKQKIVPPVG